jgi:hypothetical protein
MLEQKLFFTRNGEYTLWEKLSLNRKQNIEKIKSEIENEFNFCLGLEDKDLENQLYIYYKSANCEKKRKIENCIDKFFFSEELEQTDFNAVLYSFNCDYIDVITADRMLNQLEKITNDDKKENFKIYKYLRESDNAIDIRLTSIKNNLYKDNYNEQIINTEVRIYIKLGLILITDYTDYTHKKSVKSKLIENISYILTKKVNSITECRLTDSTLRMLLKKSKKYASKFKFSIEDFIDVDFSVTEGIEENPLEYQEVKKFYDKYDISMIKVSMSKNQDKYITVDSIKSKINSRSKCVDIKDIDEFVVLLSEVMKYNYLNNDYIKDVIELAKKSLIMPTVIKIREVESLYLKISEEIKNSLGNKLDLDNLKVLKNAFFYCLLNDIKLQNENNEEELSENILTTINKIFNISISDIKKLYNYIISIAKEDSDCLIEIIDSYIYLRGERNVNWV